jgi:nicotinate-nucleotide adenylyltransferase
VNVAIFGGTFDPIHNAHVEIARAARREFFLDKILFVPAAQPPHKPGRAKATYDHRFEMVKLACTEHPAFEASRLEAPGQDSSRANFTIQTIRRVAARLTTHDRLFFIIGSDAFSEITTWYRWRQVAAGVEFVVVLRPGFPVDESAVPPGVRVYWLRSVHSPVSSSDVRERLKNSRPMRHLLPPAVARYISRHALYRRPRRKAVSRTAAKRKVSRKPRSRRSQARAGRRR